MTPPSREGRGRRIAALVPRSFRAVAADQSNEALAQWYGVSRHTIRDWRRRTGIKGQFKPSEHPNQRRALPADFAAVAPTLTLTRLKEHYGAGRETILRWCGDAGVETRKERRKALAPPPPHFAQRAPTMLRTELLQHYRTSARTIDRWLKETGAEPLRRESRRVSTPAYQRATIAQKRKWNHRDGTLAIAALNRDTSTEGQAADHLRRFAPVYRCDEQGQMDAKGDYWRFGVPVLTGAELIERARRHGFNADAWRFIPTTPAAGIAVQQGAGR